MRNETANDNSGKPDAWKPARPVRGWGGAVTSALHHKTNNAFKINKKIVILMRGGFNCYDGRFSPDFQVIRKLRAIEKTFDYLAGSLANGYGEIERILKAAEENSQCRMSASNNFPPAFSRKTRATLNPTTENLFTNLMSSPVNGKIGSRPDTEQPPTATLIRKRGSRSNPSTAEKSPPRRGLFPID